MPDLLKRPKLNIYRGRKKTPVWVAALAVICAAAAIVIVLRMTVWKAGTADNASAGAPEAPPAAAPAETAAPGPAVTAAPAPEPVGADVSDPGAKTTGALPAAPDAAPAGGAAGTEPPAPPADGPVPAGTVTPVTVDVPPSGDGVRWVPEGAAVDVSWFDDAVMIGDSRMDGFRIYSGVKNADYIVRTGMSVYDVANEKEVVKVGDEKQTVYHILSQKQYAKVYLSMGVNELGYYDPGSYGEKYGDIIDRVRDIQPDAVVYVLTIIPVNAQKCRENKQKDYVTNEMVRQYNDALIKIAAEKDALLINAGLALADENGEVPAELSADGVHFKKEGYVIWRDFLLCHTGT